MMEEYAAYLLGHDGGHVVQRVDLVCPNDDMAMKRAKKLADTQGSNSGKGTPCPRGVSPRLIFGCALAVTGTYRN